MAFKNVDIYEYLKGKFLPILKAYKVGLVSIKEASLGEEIITYSNGIIEMKSQATTNQFVVTKLNKNKEILLDKYGHKNEWLIDKDSFFQKYKKLENNIYEPLKTLQIFVKIDEDIAFKVNGNTEYIKKNGYINISKVPHYGIQENDFIDTYKIYKEDK